MNKNTNISINTNIVWSMSAKAIPGDTWEKLCNQAIALFYQVMQDKSTILSDGAGNLPLVSKDCILLNGAGPLGFETFALFRDPEKAFGTSKDGCYSDSVETKGLDYHQVVLVILHWAEAYGVIDDSNKSLLKHGPYYNVNFTEMSEKDVKEARKLFVRQFGEQDETLFDKQTTQMEEEKPLPQVEVPEIDMDIAFDVFDDE